MEYNREHNITPETIQKNITDVLGSVWEADYVTVPVIAEEMGEYVTEEDLSAMIKELEEKMKAAAERLEFEEAAALRDHIRELEKKELEIRYIE
jgi:excinuclease ABC subunit B